MNIVVKLLLGYSESTEHSYLILFVLNLDQGFLDFSVYCFFSLLGLFTLLIPIQCPFLYKVSFLYIDQVKPIDVYRFPEKLVLDQLFITSYLFSGSETAPVTSIVLRILLTSMRSQCIKFIPWYQWLFWWFLLRSMRFI